MNIGTLNIEIAANVARIQADMEAVKKVVGSNMAEVEKYANMAKGALLGLGGVLSIRSFAGIIEGAIDAKARLYDLSLQTGITVEVLSGLGKVAKYSHTSLDDIAGASNKLSKAMFTQTEDSKGAAQAIKALGLNFDEFKRLGADAQFQAVAHSMAAFEDGTAKSAAAMLLYGKTGATLLPFLRELEERGLAVGKQTTESALEAKKYEDNLITLKAASEAWKRELAEALLPTLIAVTNAFVDARKGADSFNLTGAALKTTIETLSVVGANVAFVFQGVGRELGAWAAQVAALGRGDLAGFSAIGDAVRADGKRARADLDETESRLLGIKSKITTAADFQKTDKDTSAVKRRQLGLEAAPASQGAAVSDGYEAIIAKINKKITLDEAEVAAGRKLTEVEKFQLDVFEEVEKVYGKLSIAKLLAIDEALQLAKAKGNEREAFEREAEYLKAAGAENVKYTQGLMDQRDVLQANRKMQEDLLKTYGMTADELYALETAKLRDVAATKLQTALGKDQDWQREEIKLLEQQAQALRDTADLRDQIALKQEHDRNDPMAGAQRAVKNYLDQIKQAGTSTEQVVGSALGKMEDAFVSLATSGKFSFKDLANSIIADIVRIQVRAAITQASSGGGGLGGILSVIGNVIGGLFGGSNPNYGNEGRNYPPPEISGQRAAGGPVNAGRSYLVGERGPEILRMGGRSGSVVPNDKLGGNVYVTNNAGVDVQPQRDSNGDWQILLERAAEQGAQRGYGRAVADVVRGTGPMSTALAQRGVGLGNGAVRRF